jgi:hypothetical protein
MKRSSHNSGMTRSEIILAIAFITIVLLASYPVFILFFSKMSLNSQVNQITTNSAQDQLDMIYDLSRMNTFTSTIESLKKTYEVTTMGNVTTLTKRDDVSDTTIKMYRNNASSGIVITKIIVFLVNNTNQELSSHIETILIFR